MKGDQTQSEIDDKETSKSSHLWSFNPETKMIVICSQDGASTTCRVGGGEGRARVKHSGEVKEEEEEEKKTQAGLVYNLFT